MRTPPFSKFSRWIGFAFFFGSCFVIFFYWTFPYDLLKDRIVLELAERGYDAEILEVDSYGLTGLEFSGVRISKQTRSYGAKPGKKSARELFLDELQVSLEILPLLIGRQSVDIDAELAGGELELELSRSGSMIYAEGELDDVELRQIAWLREILQVPLAGVVNGDFDIELPRSTKSSTNRPEVMSDANGELELSIEDLTLGDGKAKVRVPGWTGGLTIDPADLGTLELELKAEQGLVKVEKLESKGADVTLGGSGSIQLKRPPKQSEADLLVRFKVQDGYVKKSRKVATALSLAKNSSKFKQATTPDGALQFRVTGPFSSKLRSKPAGKEKLGAKSAK